MTSRTYKPNENINHDQIERLTVFGSRFTQGEGEGGVGLDDFESKKGEI